MKILVFGTSTSRNSINKKIAIFTSKQFNSSSLETIDLNDYQLPIYSIDLEKEKGIPQLVKDLQSKVNEAELIVFGLAEHNGTYTTAFKNALDWMSRLQTNTFEKKKIVLVSTSPGGRGGKGVMEAALARFPIHGAIILGNFSLPKFQDNFDENKGILDQDLEISFNKFIEKSKQALV
jgi:NAD(P)H-dependent FMN reductase